MVRRIQRFLGLCEEVPVTKPRVFVRVANSTRELDAMLQLHDVLCQALPYAPVYILSILSQQCCNAPVLLTGHPYLLFYRLRTDVRAERSSSDPLQLRCEMYSKAIAFAIRFWSGLEDARTRTLSTFQQMSWLSNSCEQFDGGSTGNSLFLPIRLKGKILAIQEYSCPAMHEQAKPLTEDVQIPAGYIPGELLSVHAFGQQIKLRIPAMDCAGDLVRLQLLQGVISALFVVCRNSSR